MAELPDLDPIPLDNVTDNDLLLIYDLQNNRAYKVPRATLLGDVARLNAEVEFATISAEQATFTEVTPALLSFASGGGIADMVTGSAVVAVPTLAAQVSQAVNVTVAGAVLGMLAVVTISDTLAPGLCYHAHVSAPDTLTITFTNATAASITGENKIAQIMLFVRPA